MPKFQRFEEIKAWQKSRILVKDVYHLSKTTDLRRDLDLKSQITRASVSIMSNIAEGFERGTTKEFIRFLNIARGSCSEVRSQLYILLDVGYIDQLSFDKMYKQTNEISKIIYGLIVYLKKGLS